MKFEVTNPKAWKAVNEKNIPMSHKIKVYEKLGGAYRLGEDGGEGGWILNYSYYYSNIYYRFSSMIIYYAFLFFFISSIFIQVLIIAIE